MDVWVEAWTLPESGTFEHIATVPGVIKVRDPHSGIGRGEVVVPASWSGVDSLLSASAGSLLRVLGRNTSNARVVLFEFTPEGAVKEYAEHTTWRFQGPSIEAKLDQAIVLPFDYPTNPSVDPDWVYGFENLLTDGNSGFEINPHSLENPDAEDGSTFGWPTTGTRFEAIAPEQFEAKTGAGADTGDWYFEVTADIGEGIYQDFNPQLIDAATLTALGSTSLTYTVSARLYVPTGKTVRMEVTDATSVSVGSLFNGAAYADAVGNDAYQTVTVTFQAGTGNGGISFLAQHNATTFRVDNVTLSGFGVGADGWFVRGHTDVFQVSDTFVHSGAWSLAWKPGSGTLGADSLYIPVQTTVGQQVTASIWVYHTEGVTEDFRLVLRIPGVNPNTQNVASTVVAVPTATWTQITASGVTTTAVTEIELRYDETGVPVNTFYVDDVEFFTGTAPETLGAILGDLLTDVQTTHAAETADFDIAQLTWLKKDFSDTVDSTGNAWDQNLSISIPALLTFGQVMDRMARLGYEYRIVPNPLFPATDTQSHLLQVYNPWNPATFAGGAGVNRSATVKITSGQGVLAGPVKRAEQSRTVALAMDDAGALAVSRDSAGEVIWGQRVAGAREQHVFDSSLQELADQVMTDRAQPVTASQVEILAGQFTPYLHFSPGDTITFGLPPDLVDAEHRVAMLTYDVIGHDVVWRVDFDRAVYTGLAGTVQAVGQLLRRAGDPKRDSAKVELAASGASASGGAVEPTFLVAASNARPAIRAAADYICSGTNDHVEIAAAFAALPATGGRVQLSEGTFNIVSAASPVITMPDNSELVGAGPGTLLSISGSGTAIRNVSTLSMYDLRIANLRMDTSNVTGGFVGISLAGAATVEGCWFTGAGQSTQDVSYLYFGASGITTTPIVSHCHFYDVYDGGASSAVIAVWGLSVVVDGCSFYGTDGGYAVWHDIGINGMVISGCFIDGCQVYATSGDLTVSGCVFNTVSAGETASIVVDDMLSLSITGCTFDGETAGSRIVTPGGNAEWYNTTITGNTFHDGWVNLGAGNIYGLVISDNVLFGTCDLLFNAGASARYVRDVVISGNVVAEAAEAATAKVQFLGTALSLQNVTVEGNSLVSNGQATATSMIDLQFTAAVANSGQGLRVANNLIEFDLGDDTGYAIRLRGSTGSGYGHAVIDGNMLRAAGAGVLVSNVRDVVVSNNVQGITSDSTNVNGNHSNQLTVSGAVSAIVDGNKWIAGEAGDGAGTNSVVYVQASGSGAVRNNDIWGRQVGSTGLNTVMSYSTTLTLAGNVYHGLHTSQTGSTFTNGFVTI